MIEISELFDTVKQDTIPHMILFWGPGCAPCSVIKPIYEDVASSNSDRMRFVSFKASDQHKLAGHFKVPAIPSLVCVKQDGSFKLFTGPRTKTDIEGFLNEQLR